MKLGTLLLIGGGAVGTIWLGSALISAISQPKEISASEALICDGQNITPDWRDDCQHLNRSGSFFYHSDPYYYYGRPIIERRYGGNTYIYTYNTPANQRYSTPYRGSIGSGFGRSNLSSPVSIDPSTGGLKTTSGGALKAPSSSAPKLGTSSSNGWRPSSTTGTSSKFGSSSGGGTTVRSGGSTSSGSSSGGRTSTGGRSGGSSGGG
jgi:hypothetical protein